MIRVVSTVRATLIKAAGILNAFALACILRCAEGYFVRIGRPLKERKGKTEDCRCNADHPCHRQSHTGLPDPTKIRHRGA